MKLMKLNLFYKSLRILNRTDKHFNRKCLFTSSVQLKWNISESAQKWNSEWWIMQYFIIYTKIGLFGRSTDPKDNAIYCSSLTLRAWTLNSILWQKNPLKYFILYNSLFKYFTLPMYMCALSHIEGCSLK